MSRYPRRTALRPLVSAGCAALLGLIVVPSAAFGHAELVSSSPAANSGVTRPPTQLVLTFTEAIDPANSSVTLLGPDQAALPGTGGFSLDSRATTATVELPALQPGIYTVDYRVTSATDGHVTSGQFAFLYDPTGTQPLPVSAASSGSPSADPAAVAARWSTLVLVLLLFGTTLFWLLSARPALASQPESLGTAAGFRGSAIWTALALLAFLAFLALSSFLTLAASAIGSGVHVHPGHSGVPLDFAAPFGWTPFAIAMRVALVGTAAAFVIAVARYFAIDEARRRGRQASGGDAPYLVAVLTAAAAGLAGMSFAGHAASGGGPVFAVIDWAHLLAVGAWLGTLGGLALLAWLARRHKTDAAVMGGALARHSRLAAIAAPVVVLTGLANSPIVIGQPRDVVASDYGNLVLAKAVLFSAAVAIGAANFFLVRRGSTRRTVRLVAGEAIIGLTAVAVAATMLTIQPAATRVPTLSSSANQTVHFYGAAGSSNVHAAINIPAPGDQLYQVAVSDRATGAPRSDVQAVILEFRPPNGSGLAIRRVGLARTPDTTIWSIQGAYTPRVGNWTLGVVVQRPGRLESVDFPLTVELPLPPQLVPPPNTGVEVPAVLAALWLLPSGSLGWLLLCLLLVAVAGLATLERSRQPLARRFTWALPAARLVLVVAFVLAALGIGSRAFVEAANRGSSVGPNPVAPSSTSVARGRLIFLANCASCHGTSGSGDGPQASGMLPGPGAIGQAVSSMSDAELQYLVTNGVAGTRMPSFARSLSENERWDLVNYLHSQWPVGK